MTLLDENFLLGFPSQTHLVLACTVDLSGESAVKMMRIRQPLVITLSLLSTMQSIRSLKLMQSLVIMDIIKLGRSSRTDIIVSNEMIYAFDYSIIHYSTNAI